MKSTRGKVGTSKMGFPKGPMLGKSATTMALKKPSNSTGKFK